MLNPYFVFPSTQRLPPITPEARAALRAALVWVPREERHLVLRLPPRVAR